MTGPATPRLGVRLRMPCGGLGERPVAVRSLRLLPITDKFTANPFSNGISYRRAEGVTFSAPV